MWAVGQKGTILYSITQTGTWKAVSSGTTNDLYCISGTSDANQLWAVGDKGTILHYAAQAGRWEVMPVLYSHSLFSIFSSNNGTQLWAVGEKGTILHYSARDGVWNAQSSGTTANLESVFSIGNGADFWVVGDPKPSCIVQGLDNASRQMVGPVMTSTPFLVPATAFGFGPLAIPERFCSLPEMQATTEI